MSDRFDEMLDRVLALIAREHRAVEAPRRLEAVLRAAAGVEKEAARRVSAKWAWAVVAVLLAAMAASGALWQMRKGGKTQAHDARPAAANPARPEAAHLSPPDTAREEAVVVPTPVRKAASGHGRPRTVRGSEGSTNALDEFVQLPVSDGLPPAVELSVVRVTLKGSDLRQYGLDEPADAVAQNLLAEFVVGEDGLPRAIRIVR